MLMCSALDSYPCVSIECLHEPKDRRPRINDAIEAPGTFQGRPLLETLTAWLSVCALCVVGCRWLSLVGRWSLVGWSLVVSVYVVCHTLLHFIPPLLVISFRAMPQERSLAVLLSLMKYTLPTDFRAMPQKRSLAVAALTVGTSSLATLRWLTGQWLPSWNQLLGNKWVRALRASSVEYICTIVHFM